MTPRAKTAGKRALIEVGTEQIPARFMSAALAQFKDGLEAALREARLEFASVRTYGTLRRLVADIEGLAEKSPTLKEEVTGPPAKMLKGEDGKPTKAALGFANSVGAKVSDLRVVESKRGPLLAAVKTTPGVAAEKVLAEALPRVIGAIEFPKRMVWEGSKFRFARPIRNLLVLVGKKAVKTRLADVLSGGAVLGLPALGSKPVRIAEPAKYASTLKGRCILVEPEARRAALLRGLEAASKKLKLQALLDDELVEETVWLTEHPVCVPGDFDARFLELPRELLLTVMKKQQKFFGVVDAKGRLAAHFIGVRDGVSEGQQNVQDGFERVLAARLADAAFFFQKDLKVPLAERRKRLHNVQLHDGLGTLLQRSERIGGLAVRLTRLLRAEIDDAVVAQIAEHCYSDQPSEVVGEFPELQGVMGACYALAHGKDKSVAAGLREFHLPVTAGGAIPETPEGALVSLAGKLDILAGDFAVGRIPKGSEDPHALRRHAAGAVRILLEHGFVLPLLTLAQAALESLPANVRPQGPEAADLAARLADFLWARAEALFGEAGFKFDELRAVRHKAISDSIPLARVEKILKALHGLRAKPDFEALANAFKRASNILKKAEFAWSAPEAVAEDGLLRDEAEKALHKSLLGIGGDLGADLASQDYKKALQHLVALKPEVDTFFDKVMVMDKDPEVQLNRLRLLSQMKRLFHQVADLSELQS